MATRIRTSAKHTHQLNRYAGEWVVFVNEHIVAHARVLSEAMAEVEKRGLQDKASVFRVPRKDEGPYV